MSTKRTSRWNAGRTAAFAASLAAWCGWGMMEARAQDPLWVIGNQQVHFPQEPGTTPGQNLIRTSPLPTSFDPDIPDAYEYQGQVAQRTQNIQYDDEGKVLFFEVDGNIYNRDGLIIADAGLDNLDRDCAFCFIGGRETLIVPVAGSCTRYHVIGIYYDAEPDIQGTQELQLRWGVFDATLKNDLPAYADACRPVAGKFLTSAERETAGLNWHLPAGHIWASDYIAPTFAPEQGAAYFEDIRLSQLIAEGRMAVHAASVTIDGQGTALAVVRVGQGLMMFTLGSNGLTVLLAQSSYGFGRRWPFGMPELGYVVTDNDFSQRGEMALHFHQDVLNVALSSYDRLDQDSPFFPIHAHELRVIRWRFNVVPGNPLSVTSTIVGTNLPGANPRTTAIGTYPVNEPPPVDYAENSILRPAVAGLEFSPDGRYIYFVKSPSHPFPGPTHPQPQGPPTTFGCIDNDWEIGDPTSPRIYLPIGDEEATRAICDTQLDINLSPDGGEPVLYMIGADAQGEYWLGAFLDPNNPNPLTAAANWKRNLNSMG
ncbi:MAG: hypothetical protein WAT74_15545, partial [Flavobacteriales bacterium]